MPPPPPSSTVLNKNCKFISVTKKSALLEDLLDAFNDVSLLASEGQVAVLEEGLQGGHGETFQLPENYIGAHAKEGEEASDARGGGRGKKMQI